MPSEQSKLEDSARYALTFCGDSPIHAKEVHYSRHLGTKLLDLLASDLASKDHSWNPMWAK